MDDLKIECSIVGGDAKLSVSCNGNFVMSREWVNGNLHRHVIHDSEDRNKYFEEINDIDEAVHRLVVKAGE